MTRVPSPNGLPPLTWLRSFEAAAREESFTAAADTLGLTQAAVSQQIRKLESRLGVALFRRLPRGVELSADGAAYLPHVQASFDALRRSTQDLFATGTRQAVTLASPASFASLWLAPRLARLAVMDSTLRLSVASVQRPADYDIEQADLEIRFGTGPWPGGNAAPLVVETLSPMCSARLLKTALKRDWTPATTDRCNGIASGLVGVVRPRRPAAAETPSVSVR